MTTAAALTIQSGDAVATISRRGAELISWQVRGRELIWEGDPAHWGGRAPVLFPVVGASSGGEVIVDGRAYPMAQHGFARHLGFSAVEHEDDRVVLRLEDSSETRRHYPFAFRLDVEIRIGPDAVTLAFRVLNRDARVLPYALGYHPAFPWPFDAAGTNGHAVLFDEEESPSVPTIAPSGLLDPAQRPIPLQGNRLPLSLDLFDKGALVLRNARSRRMRFVSPTGAAIALEAEACPHLALWTKPAAPFLSMEAWAGHADWIGSAGELSARDSMNLLQAGEAAEHTVTLRWTESLGGA